MSVLPNNIFIGENTQKLAKTVQPREWSVEWTSDRSRLIASDPWKRGGDCGHSWLAVTRRTATNERRQLRPDWLSQNGEKQHVKTASTRSSRFEKCALGFIIIMYSLCVCSVCTNQHWRIVFNAFPFENSYYRTSGYAQIPTSNLSSTHTMPCRPVPVCIDVILIVCECGCFSGQTKLAN